MIDYLAIGHVTEDLWPEGTTPGGTVTYSSRTARAFVSGVCVLTAAGPNLDTPAAFPEIAVCCLTAPATTQFRNLYTSSGRVQIVSPCPVGLTAQDLTREMRASAIVHLAPVCNEVSAHIVDAVQPEAFVGITPQGWMRRWNSEGQVTSRASYWVDASLVLKRANAVVISIDDVAGDWSIARDWAAQTRLLVVTQGARGCTAFIDNCPIQVPAPAVQEIEPTGAGDIFATVLFLCLQRGDSPRQACTLANCIGAQSVTRPRLAGVPSANDLVHCAHNH